MDQSQIKKPEKQQLQPKEEHQYENSKSSECNDGQKSVEYHANY